MVVEAVAVAVAVKANGGEQLVAARPGPGDKIAA